MKSLMYSILMFNAAYTHGNISGSAMECSSTLYGLLNPKFYFFSKSKVMCPLRSQWISQYKSIIRSHVPEHSCLTEALKPGIKNQPS